MLPKVLAEQLTKGKPRSKLPPQSDCGCATHCRCITLPCRQRADGGVIIYSGCPTQSCIVSCEPHRGPRGLGPVRRQTFLIHWPRGRQGFPVLRDRSRVRGRPGAQAAILHVSHALPMQQASSSSTAVFCSPGSCAQVKTNHLKILQWDRMPWRPLIKEDRCSRRGEFTAERNASHHGCRRCSTSL